MVHDGSAAVYTLDLCGTLVSVFGISQASQASHPLDFQEVDMHQYLELCRRIVNEGVWIENERTGKRCLTVINADLSYDVGGNKFPIITTRKSYWKAAIAELLGYLRGYGSAAEFRKLGTKSWDANANLNTSWLSNPARKGEDDMGRVYGVQGRRWLKPDGKSVDQLRKIVINLAKGLDDRGEIMTFYNPGEFDLGCLRPCMHTHNFSLMSDTLYLTSYQRSCDVPLGLNFNQIQVFTLLALIAQITGKTAGQAYHKIVNAHIYEDQLDLMKSVQLKREPFESPELKINPSIKSLEDVETWVTLDDFEVVGYQHHDPIAYPFSV